VAAWAGFREGHTPGGVSYREGITSQAGNGGEGLEGGVEGTEGAETAEASEEFVGGGDVAGDLEAEVVRGGEFLFAAEALPEADFDVPGSEVAGIVEEMSFDGEAGTVEGGAHADVGNAAVAAGFAFEDSARDVDALGGEEFLVGPEI